jgi:uncharacterized protein involved in exopolysaccharide biosynthesis
MSLIQFLRILWSRLLIVVVAVVAAMTGAFGVTQIAQPRYEATSRVMMGLLKPDPITGKAIAGAKTIGAYIGTQKEIIKDYDVAGQAAEAMGWLTDPQLIRAYQARPQSDTRDFRRWLSQRVADRTTVTLASGEILEITFSSGNAVEAKVGAEALRQAYLSYSLTSRRREAAKDAAWWSTQADKARDAAEKAELAKAQAEREYGIVMEGKGDMDSQRLQALASAAALPAGAQFSGVPASSAASLQLAEIDAQLAELSKTLGPKHPTIIALKSKRATTAAVVAQEQAAAKHAATGADARAAIESALEAQTSKVISQRDKVERLRQLDAEVQLRQQQYEKTAARAGDLSIEAAATDTGMSPLGVVVVPNKPVFPNKPLILGGALVLGLGFGLALAVLIELLNRRVRGIEDLEGSLRMPCLAVIDSGRSAWAQPLREIASILRPKRAVTT